MCDFDFVVAGCVPFNRTSMELKRLFPKPQSLRITAFNRTSMELKHSVCKSCDGRNIVAFNRTSMESKHRRFIAEGETARGF